MAVSTILSPSIVSNRPLPYRTEPKHLGRNPPHLHLHLHLPPPTLPPHLPPPIWEVIGGRWEEVGGGRGVGGERWEEGGGRMEVGAGRWEVGGPRLRAKMHRRKHEKARCEAGGGKWEARWEVRWEGSGRCGWEVGGTKPDRTGRQISQKTEDNAYRTEPNRDTHGNYQSPYGINRRVRTCPEDYRAPQEGPRLKGTCSAHGGCRLWHSVYGGAYT